MVFTFEDIGKNHIGMEMVGKLGKKDVVINQLI